MSDGGNAESMVMILAISAWLLASVCGWAQEKPTLAPDTEVFIYGKEQALVDSMTAGSDRQRKQEYRNDLDRSLSVLLRRAFPKPKAHELVQQTIDALCRESESLAHTKISNSQRQSWTASTENSLSFEPVLHDLLAISTERTKQAQMVNAGLKAMLSTTGSKVADVLSVSQAEWITNLMDARQSPSSERGTLGVDVSNWPTVKVVPGMPAAKAGLCDGDVVSQVNSEDVAKTETASDGLKTLRAVDHAAVNLTVQRGNETLEFEVRPAFSADRIQATVVAPGVVDIQIPLFEGSGIADRVRALVHRHLADATSGFILDLRDNSGGRAEEADAVANIFLDGKFLQIFQFASGKQIAFKSKPGAVTVRLGVLTNRNTASAAEMLAMALHDNHRATVIGEPTAGALFGKDGEKLSDGRMIIFRSEPTILSPTGKDYSETGLPPDIVVAESKGTTGDKILSRAIQFIGSQPESDSSRKPIP
jgi:C-terminal peptidase prc